MSGLALAGGGAAAPADELVDLGRALTRSPRGCGAGGRARQAGRRCRVLDVGCGAEAVLPLLRRASPPSTSASTSSRTPPPSCSGRSRRCRSRTRASTSSSARRCSSTATTRPRPCASCAASRAPGGRVLASTHGVQVYHPSPEDYWRWTHGACGGCSSENGELVVADRRARQPAPHRASRCCSARTSRSRFARTSASSRAPSGCSTAPAPPSTRGRALREPGSGLADPELPRRRAVSADAAAPAERARRLRGLCGAIVSGLLVTPIVIHAIGNDGVRRLVVHRLGHDLPLDARLRRRAVDRPLRRRGARAPAPEDDLNAVASTGLVVYALIGLAHPADRSRAGVTSFPQLIERTARTSSGDARITTLLVVASLARALPARPLQQPPRRPAALGPAEPRELRLDRALRRGSSRC